MKRSNRVNSIHTASVKFKGATIVMAIAFIMIMIVYGVFFGMESDASSMDTYREVQVSQNDTLWSIASEYCDDSKDVRTTVKEICEINDIQPEDIQAGDTIFVPVN